MDRIATRFRRILLAALVLAAILPALPLRATWQPLLKTKFTRGVRCSFFYNEQVGFVGVTGDVGIYKTTDAGTSWIKCNTPTGYFGNFTSIFMVDTLKGWATIEESLTTARLFKTVDGGLNWITYGPVGEASCVYQNGSVVVVTSRDLNLGSGMVSIDGGSTFTTGFLKVTNGIDFVDATYGVVSGYMATPWMRTINGGRTWQTITPQVVDECWSVYAVKGTPTFYTAAERDPNTYAGGASSIRRSDDFGATWTSVSTPATLPIRTTGHITGVGEVLYVQADSEQAFNGNLTGLYRSTDRGVNWKSVGGPRTQRDTRFSVMGCNGGVIYAFDGDGQIWKSRDGGDGALAEPPITPVFNPPVLNLTSLICSSDHATITFKNLYCSDMEIEIVGFADSTLGIVSQGGLHFSHVPATPKKFGMGQGDSIVLQWDPKRAYHHDTTITTQVHIRYYSSALKRMIDTLITVNAHAAGVAPQFTLFPKTIVLDTVHACLSRDTLITISNAGCDTLFVRGADAASIKGLTLLDANGNPAAYPYAVAPGGVLQFKLHIAPRISGKYLSSILIHFSHQGIDRDSAVTVSAFVPFENAITTFGAIDLGAISTCRSYDTVLTIHNPGCDTLWVNAILLKLGQYFSLPGLGKLPKFILPDSSFSFVLRFSPTKMPMVQDSIILTIKALEVVQRISVPIRGNGQTGTSIFQTSLNPAQIDFGTRTHCDLPDSVVFTITNPGCISMNVRSVKLEGALAPDVTLTTKPATPRALIDGDTLKLIVHLNPAVRGGFLGNIHIQYQFTNKPIVDSFIAISAQIIHGTRTLSIDTSALDIGTITFCGTRDTQIIYQNTGCDSLIISQRGIAGSGFLLLNVKKLPLGLAAGERDTIKVRFIPVMSGQSSGTVSLVSDADQDQSPTIRLSAGAVPTDTLTFFAKAIPNVHAGDTINVNIYTSHPVAKRNLNRIRFILNYNGDLLTPVKWTNYVPNSTISVGPEFRVGFKSIYYPIEFMATGAELTIDSAVPMVGIAFRTTLSDSSITNLSFIDIKLNGGDQQYQKCSLGASSTTTPVSLVFLCGDSTIKNYFLFGDKMSFTAQPVHPDPFYVDRSSQILIPFTVADAGLVTLLVSDMNGKTTYHADLSSHTGENQFELPHTAIAEGVFQYRITYQPTHTTRTGKFVVVK